VRGHNGHPGNERADALANRGVESLTDQYRTGRLQSRPMRQIVLDTETTGLNHATGDRLIEIGCVELVNRRLTGRHLHFYVNPERDIPRTRGRARLTADFLADKPKFAEVVTRSATSCRTPS
jgi:DNA polymerase III epsilon subunit-like protein